MRLPTTILEGIKLPRMVLSVQPSSISLGYQEISSLMKKAYEMGFWCFDLPSMKHLASFKEFKRLTNDETLMGICHLEAERGVSISFDGRKIRRLAFGLRPD